MRGILAARPTDAADGRWSTRHLSAIWRVRDETGLGEWVCRCRALYISIFTDSCAGFPDTALYEWAREHSDYRHCFLFRNI